MKFTGERVVPTDMHNNIDTYQQHLVRYVWAMKYVVNKNILDAACGTGYGTHMLRDVAHRAMGFDVDVEALNYAIARYNDPGYLHMNLDDPWLQGGELAVSIDTIVSFETIEHLENPKKFLEWCKSVAPMLVGSIPIECPTQYHKHVWSWKQIQDLVCSVFSNVKFLYQDEMSIGPVSGNPQHGMILFVAK